MRTNLFIFTLLIIGLVSCDLNSKLLGSKKGNKDVPKKVVDGVQGDESYKQANVDDLAKVVNDIQGDEPAKEDKDVADKAELISELKKDTESLITVVKKDKAEVEDGNQYEMKDEVFKAVTDAVNNKTLDSVENKEARRLFYSSLGYDKGKIKEFAKILKKIESDATNKGTWIKDIIVAGREHLQSNFEKVIDKLEKSKDKLAKLSLVDLKEVKTKFDEIKSQREAFIKAVDSLIASYKAKTDGIDSDSEKLIKHVEKEYKDLITVKIPGVKSVYDKIVGVLDTIK
ncbi:complement regulator-acquiring protein [Borrelia puertoricensis]|uniref:complement regulator-acquiring protein n=1 Tax=Borrelia puertoricensis TaxID=2756107 RepID=UPI001FF6F58B|nr:complement regulator-acquiring protein [Borrelia puertoricensis]UPA19322.1 complement regulator-acquiring protein [Borrelia puertoricensis]